MSVRSIKNFAGRLAIVRPLLLFVSVLASMFLVNSSTAAPTWSIAFLDPNGNPSTQNFSPTANVQTAEANRTMIVRVTFTGGNTNNVSYSAQFRTLDPGNMPGGAFPAFLNQFPIQPGSELATQGADFTAASTALNITATPANNGVGTFDISVPLLDDTLPELNEDILIELFNYTQNSAVGGITRATITILYQDTPAGAIDYTYNNETAGVLPNPGANNSVNSVVLDSNQRAVIGGSFTAVNQVGRGGIARMTTTGALDTNFDPGSGIGPAGSGVNAICIISNNIVIGGSFSSFNGSTRNNIARLLPTGALDSSFNPGGGANGAIYAIGAGPAPSAIPLNAAASGGQAEQRFPIDTGSTSGTITVNYNFYSVPDDLRIYYDGVLIFDTGVINGSGTVTVPYGPGIGTTVELVMNEGSGLFGTVWDFTGSIQPGGGGQTVYVGGAFSIYNGTARNGIARIYGDGTLDQTFNPGTAANGPVYALAVQSDNKVIIGGDFTSVNGVARNGIARFNLDGTIDFSFDPGTGADGVIYALDIDSSNRVVVAGAFTSFNGAAHNRIVRLTTTGGVDSTFNSGVDPVRNGANGNIYSVKNGKVFGNSGENVIYIGGSFSEYNWTARTNVARLKENGSLDVTYLDTAYNNNAGVFLSSGAQAFVRSIAVEPTGSNVVVAGFFNKVGGGDEPNGSLNIGAQPTRTSINTRLNFARLKGGITASSPGLIQFASAIYNANESDGSIAVFVDRTGGLGEVSVDYSLVPVGATLGADYTLVGSGTLTWIETGVDTLVQGDGVILDALTGSGGSPASHGIFFVNMTSDQIPEGAEDILMVLSNPRGQLLNVDGSYGSLGASIAPYINRPGLGFQDTAIFRIQDDDFSAGNLAFTTSVTNATEGDGFLTVTVVRAGGSVGTVSAVFSITPGTAVPDVDYVNLTTTVSFGPGETVKTVTVQILDDIVADGPKTMQFNLGNFAGGATAGAPVSMAVTINDNDPVGGAYAGSVDTSFDPGSGANNPVYSVAFDQNTNLVIGGEFSIVRSLPKGRVARIRSSGLVDTNFLNNLAGANNTIRSVVVQTNNSVIVGGDFSSFNGTAAGRILRLSPDGQIDTGFNVGAGVNGIVRAIAIHSNTDPIVANRGKVIIAGDFSQVQGVPRNRVARLNTDGSLDLSFNYGGSVGPLGGSVNSVAIDSDTGDIYIGGAFTSVNGDSNQYFVSRLRSDNGAPVAGFTSPFADLLNPAGGEVKAVIYIPNSDAFAPGTLVVGGTFTDVPYGTLPYLMRMAAGTGFPDFGFDSNMGTGFDAPVLALARDNYANKGRIIAAGEFTSFDDLNAGHIVRLDPTGLRDVTINFGTGADSNINSVTVYNLDPTRIAIGGDFTSFNGVARSYYALLVGGEIITDTQGIFDFTGPTYSFDEDSTNAFITIVRHGGLSGSVSVDLVVRGGTAIVSPNPSYSYDPFDQTVTFVDGESVQIVPITLYGNTSADFFPNTIAISLTNAVGGGYGTITNAVVQLEDNDSLIAFEFTNYSVTEDQGSAIISVVRTGATNTQVSVNYATTGGGTADTNDFSAVGGTLVFNPGEIYKTFIVSITADNTPEPDETVNLVLSGPDCATFPGTAALGGLSTAQLVIVNDDFSGGTIQFQKAAYSVNENGGSITLVIVRESGNVGAVSVSYMTTNTLSTATAFSDYTPVSGTVSWADGDVSTRSFSIPIIEDSIVEGPEVINVTLVTNLLTGTAGLGPRKQVFVTINDNDSLIRFVAATNTVEEHAGTLTNIIGIERVGGSAGGVAVEVAFVPITATPGADYTNAPITQVLSWTNGQLGTLYFTNITIIDDSIPFEGTESLQLVLTNATGNAYTTGISGTQDTSILQINDNDVRVRFVSGTQTVLENAGNAQILLQRAGPVNTAVAISVRTVPIDATSDVDYQGLGRTFQTADVDPVGDIINILNHGFTNGQFVAFRQGTGVLDALPAGLSTNVVYMITNATANSFQVATNSVIVDIINSGNTVAGHMVLPTVIWQIGDAPNKTLQIPIYDDLVVEANEDFNVIIEVVTATPGSAILGTSQCTVTIIDQDSAGGGTDTSLQFLGANTNVNAVLVYPNLSQFGASAGKILIAGQFTQVVSSVSTLYRGGIARLAADGSIDVTLDTLFGGANGSITALALYTNNPASTNFGKILIGGFFTNYNGVARGHIARLNPDGSLDASFAFSANNVVGAIAIDGTDQVYIGGLFTTVGGSGSTNLQSFLARLKTDGTVDAGYNPVLNGEVNALAIQSVSGKLVVGGSFTTINGSTHNRVARLGDDTPGNASESAPDPTFDTGGTGANGTVLAIALDTSDNVFIGGQFSTVQGQSHNSVAKLDGVLGTVDGTFLSGLSGASDFVSTILIQSQLEVAGRVLLGGGFTSFNGVSRNHIARIHEDDGSLDSEINFGSGFNNTVNALAEQADGRILVGGAFTQYNSQTANHFIRLNAATNAGPGTVDFSSAIFNVVENQGTVTITVVRSGGLTGPAQVELTTTDGVALSTTDYGAVTALPVSFAPYQAVATVGIFITNNAIVDSTNSRNFSLSLANFSGASAGVQTAAIVNILDDDSYLGFGVTDYFATENQGNAVITVVRTGGTNSLLSVAYSTIVGGTATLGSDYFATNGTLVFQDGQTNATFSVPLIDDAVPDANKTVFLKLSSAVGNATVAAAAPGGTSYGTSKTYGTATLTILDDEFSPGTFVFSTNSYTVVEGSQGSGTTNLAHITILRTGGSLGSASVTLTISPSPGFSGHYADVSGVVSFANGQSSRTIDIPIDQDTVIEADELVTMALSNPTGGASIGVPSTSVLTIVDDDTPTPAGSVDFSFAPSTGANDTVLVTSVQTNGFIFIGGKFTSINGTSRNRIARLNSDGSLDLTFGPGLGLNNTVRAIAVQTDGRPIVGGDFTTANGTNRIRIARFNTNGGLDTTFNPGTGFGGAVNAIALDANGLAVVSGDFTNFNGTSINRIVRLNAFGTIDATFNPGVGADGAINAIAIQTDGKIIIAGAFTSVGGQPRSYIARLNTDGNLDPSFDPQVGPDAQIRSVALQSDGLMVIGGDFTSVDGVARNGVARLNLDGSLDGNFDPGTGADDVVFDVKLQADGQIVVGGSFTNFNGFPRGRISRLATDGTVDTSFDTSVGANNTIYTLGLQPVKPPIVIANSQSGGAQENRLLVDTGATNGVITFNYNFYGQPDSLHVYYNGVLIFDSGLINGSGTFVIPYGPGPSTSVEFVMNEGGGQNGTVWDYILSIETGGGAQPIVVGGDFTQINGVALNRFARLNSDGTVDTSFNSGAGANDTIQTVALNSSNGQMMIAGDFTLFNGVTLRRVARINDDGSVDGNFNPGTGASDSIRALVLQPDGKVVIGGLFTNYNGTNINRIMRLTTNGVKDAAFNVGSGANNSVLALGLQGTKVVAAGAFTTINNLSRNFIARLNADGAVDPGFNSGAAANNTIQAIAIYTNGPNANKILIGGDFTSYNGTNRSYVARLNTDGSLDTTFGDPLVGGSVRAIAVDSAGRVVIGGLFTTVAGQSRVRVARLLDDGSLDPAFDPGNGPNGGVTTVTIDTGDKVLIGGTFTSFNGLTENRIARLKADGTIDPTINFGTGANNFITKIAIQEYQSPSPTNRLIVVGGFTRFNEVLRNRIVRLYGGQVTGPGTLDFIQSTFTGSELPGGRTITITVVRQGGLEGTVSVDYDSLPGIPPDVAATPGVDYIQSSGTLTFVEGENTKTFPVQILDDNVVDVNETVHLVLTGATGGAAPAAGSTNSATLRIIDNDSIVQFSLPSYTVNENGGAATIQVLRTGGTVGVVSVDYSTSDGTATAGADYTATSGTLVFGDGVTSQTITVPIVNDTLPELNETIFLTLQNVQGTAQLGPQNTALLTIVDDELNPGQLQFISGNFSVSESGGSATITVIRTNGFRGNVSVQYSTTDLTANSGLDYTSTSGTLSFLDGETLQTFVVPITPDALGEADETVTLTLSGPTGGATLGTPSTAILTILDDDTSLSFASATYTVSESVSNAIIIVYRTGGTNLPVTVDVATVLGGTASPGVDYLTNFTTLAFAAGETNKTFLVRVIDDVAIESSETVLLRLSNPTGGSTLGSITNATLTILDNDINIHFSTNSYTVAENVGSAAVTVVREGNLGVGVTVTASCSTGATNGATPGLDFIQYSTNLIFGVGETNKTFFIPIVNDTLVETNETVNLSLSGATGGATLVNPISAILTIIDNDVAMQFTSANYSIVESNGFAVITVQRVGATNTTTSVDYSTVNTGSAILGTHYQATNGTLTFIPGQVSTNFLVQIYDTDAVDGSRTVSLRLVNPSAGSTLGTPNTATLTILDDASSISFAFASTNVLESVGTVPITVIRSGFTNKLVSVDLYTVDGTAVSTGLTNDFIAAPVTSLTFNPGETIITTNITIIGDKIPEPTETFTVLLKTNALYPDQINLISPSTMTVSISDDDSGVYFSSTAYSVTEGVGALTVSLLRTGVVSGAVTARVVTVNGTATGDLPNPDFISLDTNIVFNANDTTKSFQVGIVNDLEIETVETFTLSLSIIDGQATAMTPTALITIIDNDTATLVATGAVLVAESQLPPNNALDPNETVTMAFAIQNIGNTYLSNVIATLVETNGLLLSTNAATADYGTFAGGQFKTNNFTFVVNSSSSILATFQLASVNGGVTNPLYRIYYPLTLGTTRSFTNTGTITIPGTVSVPSANPASPYPSIITVSNMTGYVSHVTVTLNKLTHTFPGDLDVLLVSPSGEKTLLMSDVSQAVFSGGSAVTNITIALDDDSATSLPSSTRLIEGVYHPTDYPPADTFPAPAPTGPYIARLSECKGAVANGNWSLYIYDDTGGDVGTLQGWTLTLSTVSVEISDVGISASATPSPAIVGQPFTFNLVVTNIGPNAATNVVVTNILPSAVGLLSASGSQGTATNPTPGLVVFQVGSLARNGSASLSLIVTSSVIAQITNYATVTASQFEPVIANNSVQTVVIVDPVPLTLTARAGSVGTNGFQLQLTGNSTSVFVIEASTDLLNWTPIYTNSTYQGAVDFIDTDALNYKLRFYRAIER